MGTAANGRFWREGFRVAQEKSDSKNARAVLLSFDESKVLKCEHITRGELDAVADLVALTREPFKLADDVPRLVRLCPYCFGTAHAFMLALVGRLPGAAT